MPHTPAIPLPAFAQADFSATNPGGTQLWVSRSAQGYTAHNSRGGVIALGKNTEAGVFTPGELFKLSIAACTLGASTGAIVQAVGQQPATRIHVASQPLEGESSIVYGEVHERLEIDLQGVDAAARQALLAEIYDILEHRCPIARTATRGVTVQLSVAQQVSDTGTVSRSAEAAEPVAAVSAAAG